VYVHTCCRKAKTREGKENYTWYNPLTKSFEKQNRCRQTVRLLWASFLLIPYISVSFLPL